jgi:hypothetical protein
MEIKPIENLPAVKEKAIDVLAEQYVQVVRALHELQEIEKSLVEQLDEKAGDEQKTRGVVHAEGEKFKVEVERRVNVTYPKDRGEEHPIKMLIDSFPNLTDLFSVTTQYKESGSALDKAIVAGKLTEDQVQAIGQFRVVKKGKPKITVSLR